MPLNNSNSQVASSFQLDPLQLRKGLECLLPLLEKHLAALRDAPVKPSVKPGDVARGFATQAPQKPTELGALLGELRDKILPAVTQWQHPRFFAYYPSTASLPAILSELAMATLGCVGLQWSANPAATELECVVMDWIMTMLHAPADSPFFHRSTRGGGLIQSTAGDAMAVIMVAARVETHARRHRHAPLDQQALEELYWQDSSSLVVYMSDQTHFAGPKAVRVAGMRLHKIPAHKLANGNFGITASEVRAAMDRDRARGLTPCAVLLNYGSTNTSGYDALETFQGFREQEQVWVHVDAAYAGASLVLPEYAARSLLLQDVASSFNFNGSKWFLCGFDSAFLFVRDRSSLQRVYAADGEYLAQVATEEVYNPEFKDWSLALGRRFRSLRIWMVLASYGVEGIQAFLRHTIDDADWFRAQIDRSGVLRQYVTTEFGLVCFQLNTDDPRLQDEFITQVGEASGNGATFLMYPSSLRGERFFRIALGGVQTERSDLQFVLDICLSKARQILGSSASD